MRFHNDGWFRSRGTRFAVGALVIIGVVAIVYALTTRYRGPPPLQTRMPTCLAQLEDQDIAALVRRVAERLDADLADWRDDRTLYRTVYFVLMGGAALLSLLASILTAIREGSGPKNQLKAGQRYALIAIPALSAAFLTAASNFHILDVLQRRIDGLAAIASLQRDLLFSHCTQENVSKVDQALIDLERRESAPPQ